MSVNARFVHVNIVTSDAARLIHFYEKVFGCKKIGPDRDFKGKWFDEATGLVSAKAEGAHLLMPGYDNNGPTLEIFQYETVYTGSKRLINGCGITHIAFIVDDVRKALEEVLAFGGSKVGEIVTTEIPGIGVITFVYAKDPDGNIMELQNWSK